MVKKREELILLWLIHRKKPLKRGQGQSAFDVPIRIAETWIFLRGAVEGGM